MFGIKRALWAKMQKDSFWVARYFAGDEIWECECDWSILPRKGLIEVRIHCPNGKVGVLGNNSSLSDRAWQLKTAMLNQSFRGRISQTIGIHSPDTGNSLTYTWDNIQHKLIGPDISPTPNLSFDVVGIK